MLRYLLAKIQLFFEILKVHAARVLDLYGEWFVKQAVRRSAIVDEQYQVFKL